MTQTPLQFLEQYRRVYGSDDNGSLRYKFGFVAFLVHCVRVRCAWNRTFPEVWKGFEETIKEDIPLNCGGFSIFLAHVLKAGGYRTRCVQFESHVALEVELEPNRWLFCDPTHMFCATDENGYPLDTAGLVRNLPLLRTWDRQFGPMRALLPNTSMEQILTSPYRLIDC
jgi:hypothetical protein